MTSKTSRNDPCPCGSGKKYKKCHLKKTRRLNAQSSRASRPRGLRPSRQKAKRPVRRSRHRRALDAASNAVLDLVRAGQLDEAKRAARELLERYPEVPDGHERLGRVYEARGDHRRAAEYYRSCLEFIRARPGEFDPEYEHYLLGKIDPPASN